MAYSNYRRGYGYGYGPQAQVGYDPYSKHPDWGSALRELLNNTRMMKMWRESQECRRTGNEAGKTEKENAGGNKETGRY